MSMTTLLSFIVSPIVSCIGLILVLITLRFVYSILKKYYGTKKVLVIRYLSDRKVLTYEEFIKTYYSETTVSKKRITKVLDYIESYLGNYLNAGMLRPTDLFTDMGYSKTNSLSGVSSLWESCLDDLTLEVEKKIREKENRKVSFQEIYGQDINTYIDSELQSINDLIEFVDEVEKQFDIKILE